MKKACTQCQQELPLDCFDKQSTGRLGRRADCRECRKRFTRSKRGLVKASFAFHKVKSKRRGYTPPNYTEQDLYDWAVDQPEFHHLYEAWVDSRYQSNFKPSFDRLNDYVSYRLDNLQIINWAENNQKGYSSQKMGENTKKSKAVDMLDKDGNFLERFPSVSAAARRFNGIPSNITGAIQGRQIVRKNPDGTSRTYAVFTAYGHKWRYSATPNQNTEIKKCRLLVDGNTC